MDVGRLSDNQRRIICRMAFLLLCALPTCVVIYQILHPQTSAQWQRIIQAQLAVQAHIDSVEALGPYETILRGVEFADHDRNRFLEATEVRIIRGQVNQIRVDHPIRVTNRGLQQLIENANRQLVRSHSIDRPWSILLRKATIESDVVNHDYIGTVVHPELLIEDAVIQLAPADDATVALLEFQLATQPIHASGQAPQRIRCSLHRNLSGSDQSLIKLDTGTTALPCWLVNQWLPQLASTMGTEVEFTGRLQFQPDQPGLPGQLWGAFHQVDLHCAMNPDAAARSRWATINVDECQFGQGDVDHVAHLEVPGAPATRIRKPIEVIERFDLAQALRDAVRSGDRQATTRLR